MERILRLLRKAKHEEIPEIARTLDRQERFASVYAYTAASDARLRTKVDILLKSVPRKEHIPAGWQVALHHCDMIGYLRLMREVASGVHAASSTFAPGRPAKLLHRLMAEDVFGEMLEEVDARGRSLNEWIAEERASGVGMPEDCQMVARLRLELLSRGTAQAIRRNSVPEIREWAAEFRERDYRRFAAHYLVIFKPTEWAPEIVDDIRERYGLPAGGHRFWNTVPKEVRLAFQRLVAGQKLEEFFSDVYDPEGRFEFWRQYLDDFTDLDFPWSKEQLFMAFRGFCVVEFRDVGNAAYFYKKSEFDWVKQAIGSDNYLLKDQRKAFHRLIHREGWRSNMESQMSQYLVSMG